jgi:hypothetical protein
LKNVGRAGRILGYEKCSSKKEAQEAVRRLLAQHANKFDHLTTIEASIMCDLGWSEADYLKEGWPPGG